jgi:AAA ATPase domain
VAASSVGSSSRPEPGRMARGVRPPRPVSRPGPDLIGRHRELAHVEDELTRAEAGELRVVLLLGDPGVGKSRLGLELLARHGNSSGLFARAHDLGASAAFGLWIEAVAPALDVLSDEELIDACGGWLDDSANLFVRVASVRGAVPDRDPPVPRLLQGLGRLLGNLARAALSELAEAVIDKPPPAALVDWSRSARRATRCMRSACCERSWTSGPTSRLRACGGCLRA